MQHPRPHVQAERGERQPPGRVLEDVFVAGAVALREHGPAAQNRAEVEHVVLDVAAPVAASRAYRGC